MKKITLLASLALFSTLLSGAYASASYTCYRYVDGHPTGTWISVSASSTDEAESIAYLRMKETGAPGFFAKAKMGSIRF